MQTLIAHDQLQQRVVALAQEISKDHPNGVHMVCVLKGAFMFLADLVRAMTCEVTLDFMAVSSYGLSTRTSGQVRVLKDLDTALEGRSVIIVEDIVDTGLTL
ncbi:MAG TPA: phosphoribosyltransferase family protein, partial [Vicinamibacterales bacterium]|nr:phosphoribosyltransferase family protein [Vicinamibacterales bacterium]